MVKQIKYKLSLLAIGVIYLVFASKVFAADISLGQAGGFGILSSTYTNTASGTSISDKLGYTTGPAVAPTVGGTTHVADGTYTQAGVDQGSALSTLNSQPCDYTFGSATDLSLLSQPLLSGVYCVTGAMSIGTGGITLSGSENYIFRSTGALNTVANSDVILDGASACNVYWTPEGATTLGANSSLVGTIIDDSGITIGDSVILQGRALAYGGTVSTVRDTINVPECNDDEDDTEDDTTDDTTSTAGGSGVSDGKAPQATAPQCTDGMTLNLPANFHVIRNGSQATLKWIPTEGNSAKIFYKVTKHSNWEFGVSDITNNGNFTINALNPKLGYDWGIMQVKGCSGGQMAVAVVIDPPAKGKIFRLSYWMWN